MRSYFVDKPIIKAHAVKYFTIPRPDQPFKNSTIPLAFRTAIVCMCLYGFAFELSHSLFVGEWACPSRCSDPLHPHNDCKRTTIPRSAPTLPKPHYPTKIAITLALLAPPVAPNTAIPTTIAKGQHTLAQHFPHKPKNRTSSQVRSYLS